MSIAHTFLVPDPTAFVSGGNLYNAELIAALEQLGTPCLRCSLEEFDAEATTGIVWVDTLWMNEWNPTFEGPTGLIVHHLDSLFSDSAAAQAAAERALLPKFDLFLCTSDFTAEYLATLGVASHQCLVVEPGMHLSVPAQRTYPTTPLRALIVGNLVPRKGILPFLEALQSLQDRPGDYAITIAGSSQLDPDYAQQCLDLVETTPSLASRVDFVGELSQEAMTEAYLSHSVFLSPSMMETYGMAIKEALCMGLPSFVMTNSGFSRHHFDAEQQSDAFASSHKQLAEWLLQVVNSPRHRDQLFMQQWEHKPAPLSWSGQAASFLQQTTAWQRTT